MNLIFLQVVQIEAELDNVSKELETALEDKDSLQVSMLWHITLSVFHSRVNEHFVVCHYVITSSDTQHTVKLVLSVNLH